MSNENVPNENIKKCESARESWRCPNMKGVEGDLDMEYERYECKVCARSMKLDYDEMR